MENITVVISTYNGEKYIEKQLNSILAQTDVCLKIYIRDDGSTDMTPKILNRISEKYSNITVSLEDNIGWGRSFLKALKKAPIGDYYAFSDQDDIWFDSKLISGIKQLQGYDSSKPLLYHCNNLSVNEELHPYKHQTKHIPKPLNHENGLVQEYVQGCSMIINDTARKLVCQNVPTERIAHDFWIGLLCYFFGSVVYDINPHFYHILHVNNASAEGCLVKGWYKRLKKFKGNDVYLVPAKTIFTSYFDNLSPDDKKFLKILLDYQTNLKHKIFLLVDPKFRKKNIIGTISLKIAILSNKVKII